jgi:electron-transferring-flavoprotein dehydrogenase
MDVDIVCVGFGPANAGFLNTLSRHINKEDGTMGLESRVSPGMPLQVLCYERADDPGFGVSGVVSKARGIKASFPDLDPSQVPLMAPVGREKLVYLLDPLGASRRSFLLEAADVFLRAFQWANPFFKDEAVEIPFIPPFLNKHGGYVFSLGQFTQWVAAQVMGSGTVQVWPSSPVEKALVDGGRVVGVRLKDQGTDKAGNPEAGYLPGMDIHAALTVVGDGPVGPVGRQLDEAFGTPQGGHKRDWAVGMKAVVNLPDDCRLEPGTVLHTLGFPEPEIFGFLYVYPGNLASLGIFVPSWWENPARTAYRYLQHWMMHPYIWRHIKGGSLRSWGAKSLQEAGKRGEPFLAGEGYARVGEGSGTTNVLTNSGVDEAWTSGTLLAEGVLELLRQGRPFTRENLEASYVKRRRASWLEKESEASAGARDGFNLGFEAGMLGTALAGYTRGLLGLPFKAVQPWKKIKTPEEYYGGRIPEGRLAHLKKDCARNNTPLHDALMEELGWPAIPFDGQLLVSQQDALLMGGKVQAPGGYADHVIFRHRNLCQACQARVCVEMCSAQAIALGEDGLPAFDREKCVHCGGCLWNCSQGLPEDPEQANLDFRAGAGGLHSAEN